jgi:hypothetical protein
MGDIINFGDALYELMFVLFKLAGCLIALCFVTIGAKCLIDLMTKNPEE